MSKPRKHVMRDRPFAIYAGTSFTIVVAPTAEEARKQMLMNMGLDRKPWLARDWKIHRATEAELAQHGAMSTNPTAPSSVKTEPML